MASMNLGRVGFVPQGEYNAAKQYVKFDTVTYESNTYVAWTTVQNIEPGTDDTKWKLIMDTADLKDAIAVLEPTATADDVGKTLIAKTVADGKVTEYEFGDAVTIDDTLSTEGEAADAKATGDAISVLNTALSNTVAKNIATWEQGGL